MNPCPLLVAAWLAAAAPARAASVQFAAPDGASTTVRVDSKMSGDVALGQRIDAQFRASYYYALARLAEDAGDLKSALMLLERAQGVDPASDLLRRERADLLEATGQQAQAAVLLRESLDQAPADLDLRRRLSRLYMRLGRSGLARGLFLKPDGSDPDQPAWLRALVGLDLAQEDLRGAEKRLRALLLLDKDLDDRELLALTLQKQDRWAEAAAAFRDVLAADPQRSSNWARLANCEEAAGNSPAARKALEDGLAAMPGNGLLTDQMAKLHYRAGEWAAAEAAFGRLVELDAADAHSLLYRGLSRLKGRKFEAAEADFTALGALEKDSPSQGYALALALLMQKKLGPAEAALKKVVELNPQAQPAWVQLAFIYDRQKKLPQAVAVLKQGLKANPGSEELLLLLAAAYTDQGDLGAAEKLLREAVRNGGGEDLRFQLAVLLDKQGKFDKAETELLALIAAAPKHAQALNYLGYSWADRGIKLEDAEALLRRALAVEPGNYAYLDSLGWALHKQGRHQDALEPLKQATTKLGKAGGEDEAVVFDHLAAVQKSLGLEEDAKATADKAAQLRRLSADAPSKEPGEPDPIKEPGL
jgi:tetratricopeptide (TPR) repeat protein